MLVSFLLRLLAPELFDPNYRRCLQAGTLREEEALRCKGKCERASRALVAVLVVFIVILLVSLGLMGSGELPNEGRYYIPCIIGMMAGAFGGTACGISLAECGRVLEIVERVYRR